MKRGRPKKAKNLMWAKTGSMAVAAMISAPSENPVQRLKDSYASAPSAVAKPYINQRINYNAAPASQQGLQLPGTDFGMFTFRNALRAAIIYTIVDDPFAYTWVVNPQEELAETNDRFETTVDPSNEKFVFPAWAESDAANEVSPHGPKLYAGEDKGIRGMWIDATADNQAVIDVGASAPVGVGGAVDIAAYHWDSGIWREYAGSIMSEGTDLASITISDSGYYAVEITNRSSTTLDFAVNQSIVAFGIWAHLPLGGLLPNNEANLSSVRILAVSQRLSNRTSEILTGGSIVVAQVSKGEDWYEAYGGNGGGNGFYTAVNTTAIVSVRDTPLKTGSFAYLKPTSEDDFDWQQPIYIGNNFNVEDASFPLRSNADYLVVAASGTVDAGNVSLVIEHTWAVEYRSHNLWLELVPPSLDPVEWELGIQIILTMRQFYDNEVHWKEIMKTIGEIAKIGAPFLRMFSPIAGTIAGAIGAGATAISEM